jgi:choline-sulfatase
VHECAAGTTPSPTTARHPSWGHRTDGAGAPRHFDRQAALPQDSDPRRNGFDEEILPLHIVNGVGDLLGLIRDELPRRPGAMKLGPRRAAANPTTRATTATSPTATAKWLHASKAARTATSPWALYVGFVSPHFPLIAPPQFYDLYPEDSHADAGPVRRPRTAEASVHRRHAQVPVL